MRAILPLSWFCPPAIVTPYLSRIVFGTLAPSMPSGSLMAVTTLAASSSGPHGSSSSALSAVGARGGGAEGGGLERLARGAPRAAEQPVALEHVLEPLLLDHPQRDVEG